MDYMKGKGVQSQGRREKKQGKDEKEEEMKKRRGGRKRQERGKGELNHFMGWIASPLLLQIIVFHVLLFPFGLFV